MSNVCFENACKTFTTVPPADAPPIVVVSFESPPSLLEPAEPAVAPQEPAGEVPKVAVEAPGPAMEEAQPSTQEPQPPLEVHQLKVVEFEAVEMTVELPIHDTEQGNEAGDVPCPSEAAVIAPEPQQGTPRPAFSLQVHHTEGNCSHCIVQGILSPAACRVEQIAYCFHRQG